MPSCLAWQGIVNVEPKVVFSFSSSIGCLPAALATNLAATLPLPDCITVQISPLPKCGLGSTTLLRV